MSYSQRDPYWRPDPYAPRDAYSAPDKWCQHCGRRTPHQDAGRESPSVRMCMDCGTER